MKKFKLNNGVLFAVDTKGVVIVNRQDNLHLFLNYPEAAVWSVFVEDRPGKERVEMLEAILGKNEVESGKYIDQCLERWKGLNLIR